jgi:hypothetical protein
LGASGSIMGLTSFFACACKSFSYFTKNGWLLIIYSSKSNLFSILYYPNASVCLCGSFCCVWYLLGE